MKSLCKIGYNMLCAHLKPKLTVFLCLVLPFLYAQKISSTQDRIIRKTIQNQFGEHESLKTNLQDYYNSVVVCGADTLYNPNGYFYVFKLVGDSCIRLDKSVFHGFNFGRFLFAYNNELYALGGYGGFKANNYLLKFNFEVCEWNIEQCYGYIPKNILGSCLQTQDSIISFANIIPKNNTTRDEFDSSVYALDLKTKTWSSGLYKLSVKLIPKRYFEFRHYKIWIEELHTTILNSKTYKFITINNEEYKIRPDFIYDTATTNSVLLLTTGFPKSQFSETASLKIDSIFNLNKNIKKPVFIPLKKQNQNYTIAIIILIIIIILIAVGIKIHRNKKPKINIDTEDIEDADDFKLANTLKALESLAPCTFKLNDLDDFFKISHLSFDSKKLKRHRLIKEINAVKPGLITRERSPEDQRQFIYKINKG